MEQTSPLTETIAELNAAFGNFKTHFVERLNAESARSDELEKRLNRLGLGGAGVAHESRDAKAVHRALASFVRRGDETALAELGGAEAKAMAVGLDPDGGYFVAPALSTRINQRVWDVSPLGRLARREIISTGDAFEEPIDDDESGATWVGESEARPATATPQLRKLRVPVTEIYANQKVTQRLLDDAMFDVGGWLEAKIADKFARAEGAAFIGGDGVKQPRGLLTYQTSTAADGSRDWFTLQHVPTSNASGFITPTTSASPADCLIDLTFALRAPYRANARWLMNRATAGTVRKFKDADGRFIWQDASAGMPPMLLGFPVELDEEMPAVGANAFPIAFGDFRQAYLTVEKPGIRMLRDPYSDKPNVLFYAYRRIGGGLQNGEAAKLLKVATS